MTATNAPRFVAFRFPALDTRERQMIKQPNTHGMRTYHIVLVGRFISLLGSSMSRFALMIWAYQQTNQATTLALMGFFSYILFVPLSPLAGVLVDRWNRKLILIAAEVLSCLVMLTLILLYVTHNLQIWHLYAA